VNLNGLVTITWGRLQERHSNLHLVDYHSTAWRFERLISLPTISVNPNTANYDIVSGLSYLPVAAATIV